MSRELYQKGLVYPANEAVFKEMCLNWEGCVEKSRLDFTPSIAVLPYGPYEVSGVTTFVTLANVDFSNFKRVLVLGPSQQFVFEGISILAEECYKTLADEERPIDIEYTFDLKKRCELASVSGAHRAQSTEILLPFMSHFTNLPIVEIVYGVKVAEKLELLFEQILQDRTTFVIICANLSRFHQERDAHSIDRHIINGIMSLSSADVVHGESQSKAALVALLENLEVGKFSSEVLDYRTSGDGIDGNRQKVEGYLGALIGEVC